MTSPHPHREGSADTGLVDVSPRRPVTVAAVGDLMLGDSAISIGFGLASRYRRAGLSGVFDGVGAHLEKADIVFGNLECVLSDMGRHWGRLRSEEMRGRPEYAITLREAGFNVLNVANNRAGQHGDEAFRATVSILRSAGIPCCGLRGSDGWTSEPLIMEVGGQRIGVLGYSMRPKDAAKATTPYAEGGRWGILGDVSRLRPTVDHVIVSLHWGEEFINRPAAQEVDLAHAIIDAGAALLLGHHPHVSRPIEHYRGGVIAYSLGNFVSDMVWQPDLRQGLIVRATLDGGVEEVKVVPTYIGRDFAPRPAKESADWVRISYGTVVVNGAGYQHEAVRKDRQQRVASYRYALRNIGRFPVGILAQLAFKTVRTEIAGLVTRSA